MHVQAVFIPFIFVRMEEKGKILIIDDNKDVLFALNLLLEPYMQKVKVTTQPARIEYFMRTFQPDVVLLDMNFHRAADALLDTRCRLPNEFLEAIKAGKTVVRYGKPSVPQDWAIDATRIDLRGCERWIVSLKNIHSTLERNEMEAWQKLIRVLTHEIMNSITPVISLSETLSKRCKADPDDVRNRSYIQHGVNVIHRRSKGLLDFVENYRRLTRIASPVKTRILVKDFFSDLRRLCPEPSIRFRLPDEPLEWFADRAQMEQVFLNLLKNACEACAEKPNPEIIVAAQREGNELVFTVRDNGIGVLPEVIDRVFVPFFTTKPSGSGIGLSICKQIITLHGGHISVESENGKGSCFFLYFN